MEYNLDMPLSEPRTGNEVETISSEPETGKRKWIFFLLLIFFIFIGFVLGGLIGGLAGAWTGPGAFFTALAGAFQGMGTSAAWCVLTLAPLLGLTTAYTTSIFLLGFSNPITSAIHSFREFRREFKRQLDDRLNSPEYQSAMQEITLNWVDDTVEGMRDAIKIIPREFRDAARKLDLNQDFEFTLISTMDVLPNFNDLQTPTLIKKACSHTPNLEFYFYIPENTEKGRVKIFDFDTIQKLKSIDFTKGEKLLVSQNNELFYFRQEIHAQLIGGLYKKALSTPCKSPINWYRPSRLNIHPFWLLLLGCLAGFLFYWVMCGLLPWLATPIALGVMVVGCGVLAALTPRLLGYYETFFQDRFAQCDIDDATENTIFAVAVKKDLPPVVRFLCGIVGGMASGAAVGSLFFPGVGTVIGATVGVLVMASLALAYPLLLTLTARVGIIRLPDEDAKSFPVPVYPLLSAGAGIGAIVGFLAGGFLGLFIGVVIGLVVPSVVALVYPYWQTPWVSTEEDHATVTRWGEADSDLRAALPNSPLTSARNESDHLLLELSESDDANETKVNVCGLQ